MGFKQFLTQNGVAGIDDAFSSVMDSVAEPIIRSAYGIPGPAPAGVALTASPIISAVPAALAALQSVSVVHAAGATILMTALAADIDTQICMTLTAGAIALTSAPFLGVPGALIAPKAMAAGPMLQNQSFAIATLQWAVSLLPQIDVRITSPFTT